MSTVGLTPLVALIAAARAARSDSADAIHCPLAEVGDWIWNATAAQLVFFVHGAIITCIVGPTTTINTFTLVERARSFVLAAQHMCCPVTSIVLEHVLKVVDISLS